jgi:Xaa-Pro aminopeptidase
MSAERFSDTELVKIRALQRLAYECAESVAAGLEVGVTEKEAARRLGAALEARQIDGYFHTPFAWFGERAAFVGFRSPSWRRPLETLTFARQFFPTEKRLERGMWGILDVAPLQGGVSADIGYSFGPPDDAMFARARRDLRTIRSLILDEVHAGRTMRAVYRAVDAALARMGWENAHAIYPSSVLGHKVGRALISRRTPVVRGFELRTYLYFAKEIIESIGGLGGRTPLWNGTRMADVPPDEGLWAIEPHIRRGGLGAKWEEILVVDGSGARWLDDDLPHVRVHAAA